MISDITIHQGASFSATLTLGPLAAGAILSAQIRAFASSPAVLASFTVTPGPGADEITLSLTPAQTAQIPAPGRLWSDMASYAWDLAAIVDGHLSRLAQGRAFISPAVTR